MLDWVRETITVVAKTYPECSKKYGCLVCTAGINEQGEWRRLYPIPWALFWGKSQMPRYKKFDIISIPVIRAAGDPRQESYKLNPHTIDSDLKIVGRIRDWKDRHTFLLPHVDPDLEALWNTRRSLAIVKPSVISDFMKKERHRITDSDEHLTMERIEQAQLSLLPDFESELVQKSRTLPEPMPWLGYRFTCEGPNCRGHEMMCIDWEIQQLYRRYKSEGALGFNKVRDKAMWMASRDIHFIVGTTWRFPSWMILGLFYPPKENEA